MTNKETGSFRLGTLDDTRETPSVDDHELVDLQVKKLNRRFVWFLLITIVIMGALLIVGYLDLKNRFATQASSGSREIENISAIFEDRFNEIQKQLEDLSASFSKEMSALDQKTVVWQKDLSTLRTTVDKLDLDGAVKKEQKAILQAVQKEIAPLEKRIKTIQADLGGLEKKFKADMAPLSKALAVNTQKMNNLQDRFGPASGQLVNKDQMDLEMLKIKKAYQQNLASEISGLEKQIRLLMERVERIESRPAPAASKTGTTNTQNQSNANIQEQNLQ